MILLLVEIEHNIVLRNVSITGKIPIRLRTDLADWNHQIKIVIIY